MNDLLRVCASQKGPPHSTQAEGSLAPDCWWNLVVSAIPDGFVARFI